MKTTEWRWRALAFGLVAAWVAFAGGEGRPGPDRPHHPPGPPPPEALQACSGAQDGASCSFQHDGHTITGICRPGPRGEPAACMPDRPPPPPRESVEACAGQRVGDACQFRLDGRDTSGVCRPGPFARAGDIACAPAGQPPPHGPPPEAIDACARSPEGGACAFTDPDGTEVSGTCLSGPPGLPAACFPGDGR